MADQTQYEIVEVPAGEVREGHELWRRLGVAKTVARDKSGRITAIVWEDHDPREGPHVFTDKTAFVRRPVPFTGVAEGGGETHRVASFERRLIQAAAAFGVVPADLLAYAERLRLHGDEFPDRPAVPVVEGDGEGREVFLVEGSRGDYEHTEYIVAAFSDREAADVFAAEAKEQSIEVNAELEALRDAWFEAEAHSGDAVSAEFEAFSDRQTKGTHTPLDPAHDFSAGEETTYTVIPVTLDPAPVSGRLEPDVAEGASGAAPLKNLETKGVSPSVGGEETKR